MIYVVKTTNLANSVVLPPGATGLASPTVGSSCGRNCCSYSVMSQVSTRPENMSFLFPNIKLLDLCLMSYLSAGSQCTRPRS